MAYLQFDSPQAGPAPVLQDRSAPTITADLSPLEWSVVALASGESLFSLREPGPLTTALLSLFGIRAISKLANPRLEALRRMAVLAWHNGYTVPTHEVNAFHAAGFSTGQYEALQTRIGRERAATNGRRFQ